MHYSTPQEYAHSTQHYNHIGRLQVRGIEMYIHVKMMKDGKPTQIIKVECVVYQNKEVADLRYRGYKIANMELKDGKD